MSDGTKLDAIADQLGDLRVTLADVAGDVRAVLGRLKDHDRTDADHEARLRVVEGYGVPTLQATVKDLVRDVQSLQRWRWIMTGAAAVAGGATAEAIRLINSAAGNG